YFYPQINKFGVRASQQVCPPCGSADTAQNFRFNIHFRPLVTVTVDNRRACQWMRINNGSSGNTRHGSTELISENLISSYSGGNGLRGRNQTQGMPLTNS